MVPVLAHIFNIFYLLILLIYYYFESFFRLIFPSRKNVQGEIVLVTGAGSGIGQGLCIKFAELGCIIVGWDISQDGLNNTKQRIKEAAPGAKFYTYICDVTQKDTIYKTAQQVEEEVGDVNILVNNAGIVTGKSILNAPDDSMKRTMDINTTAHFWTLKAFLPKMMDENHGHIVTISSGAGFFGVPGQVDYAASKFAAVGLSEALYLELDHCKKTGVNVTVVCPSYIDTGMFDGVGDVALVPLIKTQDAVDAIVDAILCNQYLLMLPKLVYFLAALKPILPMRFLKVFSQKMGLSRSMDNFVGRSKQN